MVITKPARVRQITPILRPSVLSMPNRPLTTIRTALALDACSSMDVCSAQAQEALTRTCKFFKNIPWDNKWKEGWWRLINHAIPWAGGHDICPRQQPPCHCGMTFPASPSQTTADRAEALRTHSLWTCSSTQSFVLWIQSCLASPPLTPLQLWLGLNRPHGIHPIIWGVLVLSFSTALHRTSHFFSNTQSQILTRLKDVFNEALSDFGQMHKHSWHSMFQPLHADHPIFKSRPTFGPNSYVLEQIQLGD